MTARPNRRFIILDSAPAKYRAFVGGGVSVCHTATEIAKFYGGGEPRVTWVSDRPDLTDRLVKVAADFSVGKPRPARLRQSVLAVHAPREASLTNLWGLFSGVVGGGNPGCRWLPYLEMVETLTAPAAGLAEVFIGIAADPVTETLSLVRGDYKIEVVPFSVFEPSGEGKRPDFARPAVTDYGRTVSLGDYEASADAILYEVDPGFRKRLAKSRRASERTFGASLRRLRLQRKLARRDFPPLAAKTVARIERGEVGKPRGTTLRILGDRLGVGIDDIESY